LSRIKNFSGVGKDFYEFRLGYGLSTNFALLTLNENPGTIVKKAINVLESLWPDSDYRKCCFSSRMPSSQQIGSKAGLITDSGNIRGTAAERSEKLIECFRLLIG